MKTIKLNYSDYTVTKETYDKVVALVQAERICKVCQRVYTDENPEALKNKCLTCVKQSTKMEYLGQHKLFTSDYYCFKGTDGFLHLANPKAEELNRSINGTLQYYGFPYPTEWEGKRIYNEWSVYGDPAKDLCCILGTYLEFWNEKTRKYDSRKFEFFSFKHQRFIPVNKRKRYVRDLFQQGEAIVEKSRDEKGYYHINGNSFSFRLEYWVYVEAAKLADYSKL